MGKPYDVKITVLRRVQTGDILEEYAIPNFEAQCPLFSDGQEFTVKHMKMPDGFCDWAWDDIHRDIAILALGGDAYWIKKKGTMVSCCTDGIRPVIFKLERVT